MHEPALLQGLLANAGFGEVKIEKKRLLLDRVSARTIAIGQIRGTARSLLVEKRTCSLED